MKPDEDMPPEASATETAPAGGDSKRAAAPRAGDQAFGSAGSALRSVYQQTVEEQIPAEMLDLLGKLD